MDPRKLEDVFLKRVQPYCQCHLEKNNDKDSYAIDFKLTERTPETRGFPLILAWIDFEARNTNLQSFSTIHVPLRDHSQEGERKKIEVYRRNPKKSFHLAWEFSKSTGYLIRADAVLMSPEKEVYDTYTERQLTCFDVSKKRTWLVTPEDLIPTILEWLRR